VPKRSNEFQQIIADLYQALAPVGAKFQQSAMIPEPDGTLREVDVLIKTSVAGTELSLAVECRDYNRNQSIEWVDSLIGKYQRLPIDKVVAVSSSGFSKSSILKASRHRIHCLSAAQAESVDWAKKWCEPWKSLHYEMRVFHLSTYGVDDSQLTHTALDEASNLNHDDALSEKLFPTLYKMFLDHHADVAKRKYDEHIAAKWSDIPEGAKYYFEVTFNGDWSIQPPGETYAIKRILVGIGVTHRWEQVRTYSQVLHDHVATKVDFGPASLTVIRSKSGDKMPPVFRMAERPGFTESEH
jgi:hypothetical protein